MNKFNIFHKIKSAISSTVSKDQEKEQTIKSEKRITPITPAPLTQTNISVQYSRHKTPKVTIQTSGELEKYNLKTEYVCLSTSGDENVCPMCKQFEEKYFLSIDAPKLPLCPLCSCAYEYFDNESLPSDAKISKISDFILPAECTPLFYKIQHIAYEEDDIKKAIRLCEQGMKKLPEFMAPYISAKFNVPELACRDLLPELYMRLGKWDKAKSTIERCANTGAYYPKDGSLELATLESYRTVAIAALSYINENPGCLQRNIYKALSFEGEQREHLKHFLRNSLQIKKEKYNNTNKLFCVNDS